MKHFINGNGRIFGYENNQLHLVTEDMREMTDEELKKRTSPQPSPFHVWDEGNVNWIDPRTDEEKQEAYTASLPPLNRRQFMRTLVLSGIDLDTIEPLIQTIEDETTRKLALIDWKESTEFWRTDETLLLIGGKLGLTAEQINTMWELGLTF